MAQVAMRSLVFAAFAAALWSAAAGAFDRQAAIRATDRGQEGEAKFALALSYEHGEGLPQDLPRALSLYCEAAAAGHAEAAHNIGWMFLNGRGVEQNDSVAAAWFQVAVDQGHAFSANVLRLLSGAKADVTEVCPNDSTWTPRWTHASRDKIDQLVPGEIKALVEHWARQVDLDPYLVLAVITVESAFDTQAVSHKSAQGLMQLIPETAARFGVSDVFNASENVRGGSEYLRWLIDHFDGDLKLALAGYNAGEAAVKAYGGVPPYPETVHYLRKIYDLYAHPDLADEEVEPVANEPLEDGSTQLALRDYLPSD